MTHNNGKAFCSPSKIIDEEEVNVHDDVTKLVDDPCEVNVESPALPDYVQVMEVTDSSGRRRQMIFPKALNLHQPKRCRTTFNSHQLQLLEAAFSRCQYLVGQQRKQLAESLQLTETQVKVWYQNRRTKSKKSMETEHVDSQVPQQGNRPILYPYLSPGVFRPSETLNSSSRYCFDYRNLPLQGFSVDQRRLVGDFNAKLEPNSLAQNEKQGCFQPLERYSIFRQHVYSGFESFSSLK